MLDSSLALSVEAAVRRSKNFALVLQHGSLDVAEHVALSQNLSACVAVVECVAGVVLPQVVHGVHDGVAADLGGASAGVVDVVALEGDHVGAASEVHAPVVVSAASRVGRPSAATIDIAVGDGHAVGSLASEDEVLTTDAGGGNVVDPDHVSAIDGDGITSPDVSGI